MNDYSIGAMEALSWTRAVMAKCKDLGFFLKARHEVEEMILRLASGAAVSFKKKTDLIDEL